jgi:hypothetical protein
VRAACEVVGAAAEVVGDAPLAAGAALAKVGVATSAGVRTGVVKGERITIAATPIAVTISTPSVTRPMVSTGDNATSLIVVPTYPLCLSGTASTWIR